MIRRRLFATVLGLALLAVGCASVPRVDPVAISAVGGRAMLQPSPLTPGDTIMFVAPASDLDAERMLLARKRLEARGYRVKMRDDLFAVEGYLAGSDQRRVDELMQAFLDP